MTVSDIINQAFLTLGAIAAGETITADERADAFTKLNQMIESWNTEGLSLYQRLVEGFVLTGLAAYTMGPGGNFATTRPTRVVAASMTDSSGKFGQPVKVATPDEWAARSLFRGISVPLSEMVFVDYGYPTSTVYVHPKAEAGSRLELSSIKQLSTFVTVDDNVDMPPGYTLALQTNLAVILYPEYARPGMSEIIGPLAQSHKASLVDVTRQNFGIAPPPQA